MSLSKETVVLVIVANLVLTSLVVASAFLVFAPEPAEVAPLDTTALEESIAALSDRVANADRRAREDQLEIADRLSELEKKPRTVNAPAIPSSLLPESASGPTAENDPARKFAEGIGQMIQQRAKEGRDRYIEELRNPTEKSEARRTRMFKRIAREAAGSLGLDERDQAEVERILRQVDDQRREDFKALVASKPTVDDISYEEVKKILDDSYASEDQMVANSLTPELAVKYEKTAVPFRQMIYMGASSAFSSGSTDENR